MENFTILYAAQIYEVDIAFICDDRLDVAKFLHKHGEDHWFLILDNNNHTILFQADYLTDELLVEQSWLFEDGVPYIGQHKLFERWD